MTAQTSAPRPWLWPALLLSLIGYIGLALWFPLLPHAGRVPAADVLTFSGSLAGGLAYAAVLTGLFALLVVAFRAIWQRGLWARHAARPSWHSLAAILGVAVLLGLPLIAIYPINATDLFRYAQQGRLTSVYGGNPFTQPLTDYPADPFLPMAGEWAGETTPYGPVWEGLAAIAARAAPGSLPGTLMVFKAVGLLLLLATTAVLWAILSPVAPPQRAAYTALWAWNPALLLIFVGQGHNDALMLLWLLLALLATGRGRPLLGLLAVALAILTKPIAVLALPIVLLGEWRRLPNWPARLRLLLLAALGAVVLAGLAFLPWAGRDGWLASPLALVARLAREASGGAGFSPATFVYFALRELGLAESIRAIGTAFLVAFVLLYLVILWRTWRGQPVATGVAGAFFGYVVQALNFRIWYAAWPFPFLVQDAATRAGGFAAPATYRLQAGFWFLLTTQLSVILYSHVRVFVLGESQALAHLIGVPFTFLLPFVLARWSWIPADQAQQEPEQVVAAPGQPV